MEFHGCMSAIQMKPRRQRATHKLDGISWLHVSNSNGAQEAHSNSQAGWDFMAASQQFKWSPGGTQQLTCWMEFHVSNSNGALEVHNSHSRHLVNNFCVVKFEILHSTFLLPSVYYVQNLLSYHFEFLTFFSPLSFAYSIYCQMCLMSHPHTVMQIKLCLTNIGL